MADQEFLQEDYHDLNSEASKLLAMLRLISAAGNTASALTTTKYPVSASKKRNSPSSSSLYQKPLSKRTPISYPSTTTTSDTVIPAPPLHRSFSEPINCSEISKISKDSQVLNSLAAASTQLLHSLSPEKSKTYYRPPLSPHLHRTSPTPFPSDYQVVGHSLSPEKSKMPKSPSRPPLPPALRRTTSAPIPSDYQVVGPSTNPPRPPSPSRKKSSSPSSDHEIPNSKRLKRMKEKMQEMTEWCNQIIRLGEPELEPEATYDDTNKEDENGTDEESVWVEENNGRGLILHFKCPCGKGYEILLSGNNCYYKLM